VNRYLVLVLLLSLLGVVFRRRLALALKLALGLYIAFTVVRLFQAADADLPVAEVAAGVGLFALVWLILWFVVRWKERRGTS
jgi:hypothetical protein